MDKVNGEPGGEHDEANYDEVVDGELSEFDDMVPATLGGGEVPRPVDWSTLSAVERSTEWRRAPL